MPLYYEEYANVSKKPVSEFVGLSDAGFWSALDAC